MRHTGLSARQNIGPQLGWAIIVCVQDYQDPTFFFALRRCELQIAVELFVAVEKAVSADSDRWERLNERLWRPGVAPV